MNDDGRIAYTPREVAALVGVSVDTVRAAYRSGVLPVRYLTPQKLVIRREDVEAWIAAAPTERSA